MAVKQLSDGGTDGTKLGQDASDKVSFFGVTTVVQPASTSQSAVAATTTTTATTTALQTDLDALRTLTLAMRSALVDLGLIKGATA